MYLVIFLWLLSEREQNVLLENMKKCCVCWWKDGGMFVGAAGKNVVFIGGQRIAMYIINLKSGTAPRTSR